MGAVFYLYKRVFVNRMKRALHKPVTYFYIAFILLYAFMIPYSLRILLKDYRMDSPEGMAALLTVIAFFMIPGNLIAYAKRRGLVFRKSDVHFLFPAPVSPKKILLYAHIRTLVAQTFMNLALSLFGGLLFHASWGKILIYLFFSLIIENLLEGSIMLFFYGSERFTEKNRQLIQKGAYILVGILLIMGVYTYITQGLSLESVMGFLHSGMVQLVPVIGWYIAVVHLIFTGPTMVNLIGTAAYAVTLLIVLLAAARMRCTGAYFEDAMKFADDYEEVLASRRQGSTDKKFGKKQKFGKAHVTYKGSGAKALFYRQLLEYKKNKYFILDANTVAAAAAGALIAYIYVSEGSMGAVEPFIIPGAAAYVIFIFTALSGKWSKELLSPYTYLIPDTAFRKLWYATAMQHIQAAVNGILITLPGAVVMKMSPLTAALCVVFYVVLNANKLYALAVAEVLMGNTLGKMAKQFFQLFIQGIVIGFAFLGAAAGMMIGGLDLAYMMMILFLTLATVLFMLVAAMNFYKMETA